MVKAIRRSWAPSSFADSIKESGMLRMKFLQRNILKGEQISEGMRRAKKLFTSPKCRHLIYPGTRPPEKTMGTKKKKARELRYLTFLLTRLKAAMEVIRVAKRVPKKVTERLTMDPWTTDEFP
jgi:hypothetical protein